MQLVGAITVVADDIPIWPKDALASGCYK